jgi:hypothetical protein
MIRLHKDFKYYNSSCGLTIWIHSKEILLFQAGTIKISYNNTAYIKHSGVLW